MKISTMIRHTRAGRKLLSKNVTLEPSVEPLEYGVWQKYFANSTYAELNPDLTALQANEDHFRNQGYSQLRRFNDKYQFDVAYYRRSYHDIAHMTDVDTYRHWLIHGIAEGRIGVDEPQTGKYQRIGDGIWQNYFQPSVYASLNPDLPENYATEDHFRNAGYKEIRPFHKDKVFDADFYRHAYPDLGSNTDVDLYRHWIIFGLAEGRHASAQDFLHKIGFRGQVPPYFLHRNHRSDARADRLDMSAFDRFMNLSPSDTRSFLQQVDANSMALTDLGGFFAKRGDLEKAIICLEYQIYYNPSDISANNTLADIKIQGGNNLYALGLYQKVLDADPKAFWPLLNAAAIYATMGDFENALRLIKNVLAYAPSTYQARRTGMDYVSKILSKQHHIASRVAASGEVDHARNLFKSALDSSISDALSLSFARAVDRGTASERVAIFAYNRPKQCFRYRVEQKIEQLRLMGYEAKWFDAEKLSQFRDVVSEYRSIIFFRVPGNPDVVELIQYANALGIQTFYEIDDLIIDPDHYPPKLESLGGLVTEAEWGGLALDPVLFSAAAENCMYGIGSTDGITNRLQNLVKTGTAFTYRNGFLDRDYAQLSLLSRDGGANPDDRITILYGSGSRSHTGNFNNGAAQAIATIMADHANVNLHIIGPLTLHADLEQFSQRVVRTETISGFADYLRVMATADINVAPLDSTVFSDAKSEIKWLEAALLRIPSIVTATTNYRSVLRDGVDGIMCSTEADWYSALDHLIQNPSMRKKIGEAAYQTARGRYNESALGQLLIEKLLPERDASELKPRKNLRVAQVNVYFSPQTYGGATRIVETLVQDLCVQECSVEAFTSLSASVREGELERYSAIGCNVTAVTPEYRPGDLPEDSSVARAAFSDFLDRFDPDVIHFHCIQVLTASLLDEADKRGIPSVVTIHDGWWISDHQFLVRPDGSLVQVEGEWGNEERIQRLKKCLSRVSKIVSVSDYFAKLYQERTNLPVSVIPNPVAPLSVPPGPTSGPVMVGFLGGMGLEKGGDLIYKTLCLREFDNLRFVLVDHTMPRGQSRSELWGRNLVSIVGKYEQSNIGELYEQLNVILAPSICVESFGLVVREAISIGRWVVVSDRGALSEKVNQGVNGYVVDVSSFSGLMRTLNTINAHPERHRSHSDTELSLPSSADVASKYIDVYRSIIEDQSRPAGPSEI